MNVPEKGESLSLREVVHGSPSYWATVALRNAILRKPLGLCLTSEELAQEQDSVHLACFRGAELVGCLVLRPQGGGVVQMRQVAVAPDHQGQGIGSVLVARSEQVARDQGFRRMVLHARETAVRFYERLGYRKLGERFVEVTIPHQAMEKLLA